MKITIVFKKGLNENVITFDTRKLAKNYIKILKSEQKNNPCLGLADLYYPEDLNGYIESVLDNECIDSGFYYEYNEDVEKLIEETAIDMEIIDNECYVSLEVAKLLKEAGFVWECRMIHFCYIEDDHMWNLEDNHKSVNSILKNIMDKNV